MTNEEIENAILTLEVLIDEHKENGSNNACKEWDALNIFKKLSEENEELKIKLANVRMENQNNKVLISNLKEWLKEEPTSLLDFPSINCVLKKIEELEKRK